MLFSLALCLLVVLGSTCAVQVLNPDGYLIGNNYQYASCEGDLEAVTAWAVNKCIFNGILGYPYLNTYVIISPVFIESGVSYVNIATYFDAECQQSSTPMKITINACTNVGSAVYFYFSSTEPNWNSYSDGVLLQKSYNFTGVKTASNGCNGTQELVTAAWFMDKCQFNCAMTSCQWTGCAPYDTNGGIALLSVYDEEYCPADDFVSTSVVSSSCTQSITCISPSSSPASLSKAAVAGITFSATFVGMILAFALIFCCCLRKKYLVPRYNTDSASLVEPINHNVIVVQPSAPVYEK